MDGRRDNPHPIRHHFHAFWSFPCIHEQVVARDRAPDRLRCCSLRAEVRTLDHRNIQHIYHIPHRFTDRRERVGSTSLSPSGSIKGAPIANTRNLNTTGKFSAFLLAYAGSTDRVMNDNGRYRPYFPYPTVGPVVSPRTPSLLTSPTPQPVSFTEGVGPEGYIELSPGRLAVVRARIGAANTLPYLAGSAPVVAQSYENETLAYTTYKPLFSTTYDTDVPTECLTTVW